MTIKKSYTDIVDFLTANKDKKVSSIMAEVLLMTESKKASSTFIVDSKDNVLAIYCWYHKQWEILEQVPFGSKANSTTGFNTMCKVGTSAWTKKQRIAKQAKTNMLDGLADESIKPSDIKGLQVDIEEERTTMDKTDMPKGVANEVEIRKALEALGHKLK